MPLSEIQEEEKGGIRDGIKTKIKTITKTNLKQKYELFRKPSAKTAWDFLAIMKVEQWEGVNGKKGDDEKAAGLNNGL